MFIHCRRSEQRRLGSLVNMARDMVLVCVKTLRRWK